MSEYLIITDSSCDLTQQMAQELDLLVIPMPVWLEDKRYLNYLDGREIGFKEFYDELRAGKIAKTAALNVEDFREFFRPLLNEGKDILYLGFSSGLSGTYQCSYNAAEMLREEFPDRKIITVDTLCASMGQGLMVYHAVQQKRAGKTMEEVRDFVLETIPHLSHWVMVDDLHCLKRGGRISAATEIVGSMLNIKPIIHVDNEGHLIKMDSVRGRKAGIRKLKEKLETLGINPSEQVLFISHGDCEEDAQLFAQTLKQQPGAKEIHISFIGPVIGSHSGPGTLTIYFLGTER